MQPRSALRGLLIQLTWPHVGERINIIYGGFWYRVDKHTAKRGLDRDTAGATPNLL